MISDESDSAPGGEQGEFHGGVIVPVKAFTALRLGASISEEDLDVERRATPSDDAEGLSDWGLDAFALGAHARFLHGGRRVATRREGVGLKMR